MQKSLLTEVVYDYLECGDLAHSLTTDGLFDERGVFYCMPKAADIQPLAELFRANVLKLLKREGLINDELIDNLMKWRQTSGFSVHNGVRARDDQRGQTVVAQYILRNPFSQGKITFNETIGMVVYKSKMTPGKAEGGKRNFAVYPACDFIAAITQHIPKKGSQMVRLWLVFEQDARGETEAERAGGGGRGGDNDTEDVEIVDVSNYKPRRIPSPGGSASKKSGRLTRLPVPTARPR